MYIQQIANIPAKRLLQIVKNTAITKLQKIRFYVSAVSGQSRYKPWHSHWVSLGLFLLQIPPLFGLYFIQHPSLGLFLLQQPPLLGLGLFLLQIPPFILAG